MSDMPTPAHVRVITPIKAGLDLEGCIEVFVPEVWLQADERMRQVAERVDSIRTRRAIAGCLDEQALSIEGVELSACCHVMPHGEGERLGVELTLTSTRDEGADAYTFELERKAEGVEFGIRSRSKLIDETWSGGCIPWALIERMFPAVVRSDAVSEAASRFSRAVVMEDIGWEWAPEWAFDDLRVPGGRTVRQVVESRASGGTLPFVVLASWSMTTDGNAVAAGGVRVRVVLDPVAAAPLAAWEEQWRELF